MSAIQVAIRIKPETVTLKKQATVVKSPFALDEDHQSDSNNNNNYEICLPWRVEDHDTLRYDGTPLPEGVRPSGPLAFTFGSVYKIIIYNLNFFRFCV